MSWKDKYDKCNKNCYGELVIFGEHYNYDECIKIIDKDDYDEIKDYSNMIEHIWLRFGFVNIDCETTTGWNEVYKKPKSMKGVIKATKIYTHSQKKDNEEFEKTASNVAYTKLGDSEK